MAKTNSPSSCLIVGGGIAGLTAAGVLRRHGVAVTVLEKSSHVGGRMATRRLGVTPHPDGFAVFDHGAQFFTARSGEFKRSVAQWIEAGVAREWFRGQPGGNTGEDHPRFRGIHSMASIPESLAQGLDVRLDEWVTSLRPMADSWRVTSSSGNEFSAAALILTPPVPLSLAILTESGIALEDADHAALQAIAYEPCISVTLLLDGPGHIPAPGAIRLDGGPVAWVADNHRKGISPVAGAVTIHAGAEWSREHFDENIVSDKELAAILCDTVGDRLGAPVLYPQVQRWRYSKAVAMHPRSCLAAQYPLPLVFAGDAFTTFGTANVESAALSGLAAARAVLGSDIAL